MGALRLLASGDRTVTLWGTGSPWREFLYSDDMAEACTRIPERGRDELSTIIPENQASLIDETCAYENILQIAQNAARVS